MSEKHTHPRRRSWARLRLRAQEVITGRAPLPESEVELAVLLLCILGASGVGLLVAGVLAVGRGLL
jgi:hypothetical protein